MAGPSHFVDVKNVTYNSVAIYSVTSITVSRDIGIIFGQDNGKLRPVSSHNVSVGDSVTLVAQDIGGAKTAATTGGAHPLVFDWTPASNQLNGSALAEQTVTINNLVWTKSDMTPGVKAIGSWTLSGIVTEMSDASDPVVYT